MNTKTMEGLVGAGPNMKMTETPMRVFKEARRRGDIATMERAMGYVSEFSERSGDYKSEADQGMKEDAEEARKKAELEAEKAIQKRKEEREQQKEQLEESKNKDQDNVVDVVEISEDGKGLSQSGGDLAHTGTEPIGTKTAGTKYAGTEMVGVEPVRTMAAGTNAVGTRAVSTAAAKTPVTYTKAGTVAHTGQQGKEIFVSV